MSERRRQAPGPSISASPDDVTRRPRSGRRGGGNGGAGRSIAMSSMLVIVIAGLAVAGWFIANQQQLLDQSERRLAESDARLSVLEQRLRSTDEAMSETGADTNEQLTFWQSEIRKLWDVTNKRNKKWIEDNQATIKRHTSSLTSNGVTLKSLKSSVSRHDEAFDQQQEIIDRLTSIDLTVRQLVNQQRNLVDKVNTSSQIAASLKASLESRVAENEQAVAAIDAYRLQVNGRLNDLERRREPAASTSP